MSTYIKGPICGVANCPSRLWRIIDGRRTCQYGHVMDGDVEFNNEDDDIANSGVITRRLNLTTNATGSFQSSFNLSQSQHLHNSDRSKKVYGYEAHVLFLKAFQYILKRQVDFLVQHLDFPNEFEIVVKIIWGMYLKLLSEQDDGNSNELESTVRGHFKLNSLASLAMMYMASVHMGLPVYIRDFIRWLSSAKVSFFNATELLPETWREKLPNYYLALLEGGKVPHDGQLFQKISQLCSMTDFTARLNCQLTYEPLIFKLVTHMVLPPEFYMFTLELIQTMDEDENFRLSGNYKRKFRKYYLWAELRVVAYFVLTVRWVLLCDLKSYPLPWIQAVMKFPRELESSEETKDVHAAYLSAQADTKDITEWDTTRTSAYLEWVEKRLLPMQKNEMNTKIDHKIAMRKLHKIFPMDSETYRLEPGNRSPSYIEELQEKYNYFHTSVENSCANPNSFQEDPNERILCIHKLEQTLIHQLSLEYGCSIEQLRVTIDHVENNCRMRSEEFD